MKQPPCIPPPTQTARTGEPGQLLSNAGHLGVPHFLIRDAGQEGKSETALSKSVWLKTHLFPLSFLLLMEIHCWAREL